MSVQKTLFNLNFNPMRGEDILFEYKDSVESTLNERETSLFHLLFGIGIFIFGLIKQISSDIIPQTNIAFIDTVLNFLFSIPFLFIFIGLLEITLGFAKKFKKFFTLIFHQVSNLFSKPSIEFLVTNYRLIYIYMGEAGLGSKVIDIFYDQIENVSLIYPIQLKSKRLIFFLIGGLIISFPLLLYVLKVVFVISPLTDSIIYVLIGAILIIKGILMRDKYSPYQLIITMNDHRFYYSFIFPANTQNLPEIMKQCREFRLGGNRS